MEEEEEELDNSWIREFKEKEEEYDDFYKEKPSNIKLFFLYVNKSNDIEFLKEESYLLDDNATLPKFNLMHIIKNKKKISDKNYKLISLLKFNITINPEDVPQILDLDNEYGLNFLTCKNNIEDIKFEDSVCILQDINALYFVFYLDEKKKKDTKRIIFSKNIHKTRRKRA